MALIATFAAGTLTGGFLTGRAIRDAVRRAQQPREAFAHTAYRRAAQPRQPPPLAVDRLQKELQLKPEQADKLSSILTQMDNELNNLRSLNVRETDGIFSRAKDRMDPIVAPDQRPRLQEILDARRRDFENGPRAPAAPQ